MTNRDDFKPAVNFLGCSTDPVDILYTAVQVFNNKDAFDIWEKTQTGRISKTTMQQAIAVQYGHVSIQKLRQVAFVFVVCNISHATALNFKHRYADTDSGSLACSPPLELDRDGFSVVTPPAFYKENRVLRKWKALQNDVLEFIQLCRQKGIETEDTAFALPLGTLSKVIMAMGFQPMQRLLDHHLCEKAHWEMRSLSWQIYRIVQQEFPVIAKKLGIKCWENRNLYCDHPKEDYLQCRWRQTRPHMDDLAEIWNQPTTSKIQQLTPSG